jgi:DNA-binding transcriptional ArsR family regulator
MARKRPPSTRKTPSPSAVRPAATGPQNAPESATKNAPTSEPNRDSLPPDARPARWTFLTNHSHVLILLSQDSSLVLRQVASRIGITERAVQRIIADLEEEGFIEREKVGRKNHYRILTDRPLRHPIESHRSIGDLIALMMDGSRP